MSPLEKVVLQKQLSFCKPITSFLLLHCIFYLYKHVYWPCSMTKCKHILNWNSILDFFKWTHKIKQESETCAP